MFSLIVSLLFSFPWNNLALLGGIPLSPAELEKNKYGAGLFVEEYGEECVCVWSKVFEGCIYPGFVGRLDPSSASITVMGASYEIDTNIPPQKTTCNSGRSYDIIKLQAPFPPTSVSPAVLSPTSANLIPPKGTKCEILGFSHTDEKVPGLLKPNKYVVEVSDYQECRASFPSALLPESPKGHFCAFITSEQENGINSRDGLPPIYCPNWKGAKSKLCGNRLDFGHLEKMMMTRRRIT